MTRSETVSIVGCKTEVVRAKAYKIGNIVTYLVRGVQGQEASSSAGAGVVVEPADRQHRGAVMAHVVWKDANVG
jgi:hypothetical protein